MKHIITLLAALTMTFTAAYAANNIETETYKAETEVTTEHTAKVHKAELFHLTFGMEKVEVKERINALVDDQKLVLMKNNYGKNQAVEYVPLTKKRFQAVFTQNKFENGVLTAIEGRIVCPDHIAQWKKFKALGINLEAKYGKAYTNNCTEMTWIVGAQKIELRLEGKGITILNGML